jgi:XTP/dITP diphosphohydrolase
MKPIVLVLGSRNRKKCKEMAELIAPPWEPSRSLERLDIRSVDDFPGAPEVIEDADTFAGNARKKASELARALLVWVVADDSGLTVDALGGAPGVFSARYAGEPTNDDANNRKVLESLAATPDDLRGAAFRCALALADPAGTIRLEAEGACRGRLTR